mmetsp:Transcript_13177/g.37640  ORF Transcript_13177/g.37640 Transcript_13177/m.37640 type:complete len:214 (+) Transcript_13177:665-1306(+)
MGVCTKRSHCATVPRSLEAMPERLQRSRLVKNPSLESGMRVVSASSSWTSRAGGLQEACTSAQSPGDKILQSGTSLEFRVQVTEPWPQTCSRRQTGKAESKHAMRRSRVVPMCPEKAAESVATSRVLATTVSHIFLASQCRSLAVFVRKTSSRPKAVPTSECMASVSGGKARTCERQTTRKDQAVKKVTGTEMRRSRGEEGQVMRFRSQSRVV